jgi:molybdenum cofactor synthesis domain-containing protein
MLAVGVLTISDKGARGERHDESGQAIVEALSVVDGYVVKHEIVPDEKDVIAEKLASWADEGEVNVILTTGGTGLSPRDVTPEATMSILDKYAPGFGEAMRAKTYPLTPMAMLSRAVAGVRGRCLIINLPGSPQGVVECLRVVLPLVPHAVAIIQGEITEHPAPDNGRG